MQSTALSSDWDDDAMLTFIRMAGWDVTQSGDYTRYLIDPHGTAFVVPYLTHQRPVQVLFDEFLRYSNHL